MTFRTALDLLRAACRDTSLRKFAKTTNFSGVPQGFNMNNYSSQIMVNQNVTKGQVVRSGGNIYMHPDDYEELKKSKAVSWKP